MPEWPRKESNKELTKIDLDNKFSEIYLKLDEINTKLTTLIDSNKQLKTIMITSIISIILSVIIPIIALVVLFTYFP